MSRERACIMAHTGSGRTPGDPAPRKCSTRAATLARSREPMTRLSLGRRLRSGRARLEMLQRNTDDHAHHSNPFPRHWHRAARVRRRSRTRFSFRDGDLGSAEHEPTRAVVCGADWVVERNAGCIAGEHAEPAAPPVRVDARDAPELLWKCVRYEHADREREPRAGRDGRCDLTRPGSDGWVRSPGQRWGRRAGRFHGRRRRRSCGRGRLRRGDAQRRCRCSRG